MMNNDQNVLAFFRSQYADDYKRLVLSVTCRFLLDQGGQTVSVNKVINELTRKHALQRDACEDAISALRSASGCNAVHCWSGDSTKMLRVSEASALQRWASPLPNGVQSSHVA